MVTLNKSDFGAEILSILTKGMYPDPRDSLREYIQNGVDAGASKILLKIRQKTIVVEDDGKGMDITTMRKSIRLGVSEKDPKKNVGFMGIGLYSSFHLCDNLAIYSKFNDQSPNKLFFDFKSMRKALEEQRELRLDNSFQDKDIVALQNLMEDYIQLSELDVEEFPIQGTRVEMTGLEPSFFKSIEKFDEISNYLERVIPLPFHPDFKWGVKIENKIREVCNLHSSKFELVNLKLQIDDREETLYRPYTDQDFNEEPLEPEFFELKNDSDFFGISWGCLNSNRTTVKNNELRGFLIRKQGFAIGSRHNLLTYFKRQTYFNRYIGEIIVVNPFLLPNAPRSDFEFSSLRASFYNSLWEMANYYNAEADKYQENTKFEEDLDNAIKFIKETELNLNIIREDSEKLLEALRDLNDKKEDLSKKIEKRDFKKEEAIIIRDNITKLIIELEKTIQLRKTKNKIKKKTRVEIIEDLKKIPSESRVTSKEPVYKNFEDLLQSMGIDLNEKPSKNNQIYR